MSITASMFSDPTQRAGLAQYYENMKAEAIASLKAREADPEFQATFNTEVTMPDGTTKTAKGHLITAEMAEKAFVPFDQWMEITQRHYEIQERMYDMAQKRMDMLQEQNPDSPSHVRATFSHDGTLLAYVNEDGSLVTSNGAEKYLKRVLLKADELGLTGQARADYLSREVQSALSQHYQDLDVATYDEQTSPTKREFADMWYKNFDIDQHYQSALADALESLEHAKQWYDQMQANLRKMQDFLLSLQEAGGDDTTQEAATDEFLAYMEMSTEEKYLEMYLRQEKMTREEFDALPPEAREKIMAGIRENIRKDIEKETGIASSGAAKAA